MDSQQPSTTPPSFNSFMRELEKFFNTYLYEKVPFKLPEDIKEFIVKYSPWINVVVLVLIAPVVLLAFGFRSFGMPFGVMISPFHNFYGFIIWILAVAAFVMLISALPGLFTRSVKSWYLVYYATLVNALSMLISQNFPGFVIGTALSIYVLFQIKSKYH